ncbi:hypothetical protein LTR94_038669, partial [Friedmanniomyces endolithicus]
PRHDRAFLWLGPRPLRQTATGRAAAVRAGRMGGDAGLVETLCRPIRDGPRRMAVAQPDQRPVAKDSQKRL